jgi:FtsP/CotA-like multicopper oxidase with cupredoxin domain
VSQQPVPPGGTFTYRFKAEPAGTFWYHSHTAEQYGDGLRGPLIVDDPNDPHKSRYDTDSDDHVLMLADVFTETVGAQLAALQRGGMGGAAAEAGKPAAESMMGMPANPVVRFLCVLGSR